MGKSTTAVSLGASLAELGYKVLVVDLDPQGNASTGLGIRHEEREVTVYDVLADEAPIERAIVPTPIDNLFAIPSTIDLAGAEIELVSQFSRELRLKKAIEPLKHDAYDFVFLHYKDTDKAGEDGDFAGKVAALERLDAALPGVTALNPDVLVVSGDHATPAVLAAHSWHPVPVALVGQYAMPDAVERFSERACGAGSLGILPAHDLMPLVLAHALRLTKYGA